jgi:hypothetical protein
VTTPRTRTHVAFRTYGPGQVPPLLDVIADIWADAHPELVDNPAAATAGLSAPALHRQITGHLKHQGFALVVAYADGTAGHRGSPGASETGCTPNCSRPSPRSGPPCSRSQATSAARTCTPGSATPTQARTATAQTARNSTCSSSKLSPQPDYPRSPRCRRPSFQSPTRRDAKPSGKRHRDRWVNATADASGTEVKIPVVTLVLTVVKMAWRKTGASTQHDPRSRRHDSRHVATVHQLPQLSGLFHRELHARTNELHRVK